MAPQICALYFQMNKSAIEFIVIFLWLFEWLFVKS